MIYFELTDTFGNILSSTIKDNPHLLTFEDKRKQNIKIGKLKQIVKEYSVGMVRLIGDSDDDAIVTTRITNRTIDVYAKLFVSLGEIKINQEKDFSIFSHNLITTHSRLQDEIESIIPEAKLAKAETYSDQVNEIRKAINEDIDSTAESIFAIAKRIIDLKAQIAGFKILSGSTKPELIPQNIKKVLLNIIYPYYEDFRSKDITVRIYIDENLAEKELIKLDYKIINIALHHFLNNAVKYSMQNSYLDIRFDFEKKLLQFDMISLRIDEDEIDKLCDLKFSGRNARNQAGDGIGMFMLKKALDLLGAEMIIEPRYHVAKYTEGREYNNNLFSLHFR